MQTARAYYGSDPTGVGFYWADSQQKRQEALSTRRNAPAQFEAVYQCNPGARSGTVFLRSDFAYYPQPLNWEAFRSRGDYVVQSWDTGGSSKTTADYSVCITALFVPCQHYHCGEDSTLLGPCEDHYDVYIMDIYRERKDFGDLLGKARELNTQWRPSVVLIEQKSTGDPLLGTLVSAGLPAEGVKPGVLSKRARAVTSVGAGSAQGWLRMHRIYFPEAQPHSEPLTWVEPLERELLNFTGDEGNTDDQVDALVYLAIHAIAQGGGGARLPTDTARYEAEALRRQEALGGAGRQTGIDQIMAAFTGQQFDPFQTACERCTSFDRGKQFCLHHNRKTFGLNSCPDFSSSDHLMLI